MPPTKKPAGTAVNPRNGRRLELAAAPARFVVPAIDRDVFLPASLLVWDAYWSDPVAASQTPADTMLALLWIEAYDDYRRKKAAADREPISEGSMGQQVANPLYAVAKDAMAIVMACAQQLGIGAKNRAALGLALIAEKAALDDVNARYAAEEVSDDGDDDDPRVLRAVSG